MQYGRPELNRNWQNSCSSWPKAKGTRRNSWLLIAYWELWYASEAVQIDTRARTLLLDIGGVAIVDTAVANHLIKIAKAAVLMGCKTIISGISPAIAQTITELGIDLGSIQTTSTIESALRDSITRPGAAGRSSAG